MPRSPVLVPPVVHPVPYGLLLFDADLTLRETVVDGVRQARPPNHPSEWGLLPYVRSTLRCYDLTRIGVSIVSNQGGVGLGYLSDASARGMLRATLAEATGTSIQPWQVLMCPHAPRAGCGCRKPHPTLLWQALTAWRAHGLLVGEGDVLVVGDDHVDHEAARQAGFAFSWAQDFFAPPVAASRARAGGTRPWSF